MGIFLNCEHNDTTIAAQETYVFHNCPYSGIWVAGNGGMEKNMESTIIGSIGTTIRFHSFFPS